MRVCEGIMTRGLRLARIGHRRAAAPLIYAALVTGCTTQLTHERIAPTTVTSSPGFPYYLPKQRYSVVVTYELTSCPNPDSDVDTEKAEPFRVVQTAAITETSVADESQYFLLTYPTLNNVAKTTTFSATSYDNKTLHTIGVQVEDRTAAILKSFVGSAVGVAKMAVGLPAARQRETLCNHQAYRALRASRNASAKLVDPKADETARAVATATITAAKAILQIQKTHVFVPSWQSLAQTYTLAESDLTRWLSDDWKTFSFDPAAIAELKRAVTHEVRVVVATPTEPPAPKVESPSAGVVFRDPVPAVVQACMSLCSEIGNIPLATAETQIAQLGRSMVLTLVNEAFDKNNLTVSFAANGRLESLTYGSESRLEKAAGALEDTVTQVEGFVDKRRAARQAAADAAAGAELQAIKAQTDLLAAKAALIEAENKLRGLGGTP